MEKRLEGLSREQKSYFTWLCSIRAVPFLCVDGGFSFWGEKKFVHLKSVFYVHDICAAFTHADATMFAVILCTRAASRAADAASHDDALAARAAARTATRAFKAADAAALAIYAAYATHDDFVCSVKKILHSDLDIIESNSVPSDLNNDISIYGDQWKNFLDALKDIDCAYWAKQYEKLFENHFVPNLEEIKRRLEVPNNISDKGAAAIAKHMDELAIQGDIETKEARIILLGSKGAGKTSLARKLRNTWFPMPRKSESTAGVDTFTLNLIPGETTHLWDFGGHVVAQAAHKCFMSAECVYILVINGRTEEQKDEDNLRKWLATVKTYSGKGAKVFIVINESDDHHQDMPEDDLMQEFPDIIESFHYFNITNKPKLREFRGILKEHIENNLTRRYPTNYFAIKKEFEDRFKKRVFRKYKNEILRESEVEKIISGFNLKDGSKGVKEYLSILGVALSYDNIPDIVLNPSWISNGIYTIINHMQNNRYIAIHKNDISRIFKDKESWRYNASNCKHIYDLMINYELAFEMKNKRNTLIVPSVLSDKKPDGFSAPNQGEETLVRRYGFDIALTDSIFPRYIQRNHEYLEIRDGDCIMWKGGMSLEKDHTYAIITKKTREIEITAWGENKSNFLSELHKGLEDLLEEHHSKWERDEIKLLTGFCSTDVIFKLHKNGMTEYDGEQVKEIVNKFYLVENLFKLGF